MISKISDDEWCAMRDRIGNVPLIVTEKPLLVAIVCDGQRVTVQRPVTESRVNVTRAMADKTLTRLASGEEIPFRSISYTVAIENTVLWILSLCKPGYVQTDRERRVYASREAQRERTHLLYEHGGLAELDSDYYRAECPDTKH